MKPGSTFSMTEARNRYLLASGLLIFLMAVGGYVALLLPIACAVQAVLLRLSRPSVLAFVPTLLGGALLFVLLRDPVFAAIVTLFVMSGFLLRRAQVGKWSRNATLGLLSVCYVLALAATAAYTLYLLAGTLQPQTVIDFLVKERDAFLAMMEKTALESGADAQAVTEYISQLSLAIRNLVVLLPATVCLISCLLSLFTVWLFRVVCRAFSMPDGFPERGWELSLSLPYAVFYVLLFAVSMFLTAETAIGVAVMNLSLLFGFIIALIGVRDWSRALSFRFPRISARFFMGIFLVLLLFSAVGSILWSVVPLTVSAQMILNAFRNKRIR